MKEMRAHLEKLRDQADACTRVSAGAETQEKRELFADLAIQLMKLIDQVERVMAASK